jgi:hypothetical protein
MEKYVKAELEITEFEVEDVITTSNRSAGKDYSGDTDTNGDF